MRYVRVPLTADTPRMMRFRALTARVIVLAVASSVIPIPLASPASAARTKTITITDASVVEGDAGTKTMSFTVAWTGVKGGGNVSVEYATADGSALAASDYTSKSGSVTLSNSACRCATIAVSIAGDALSEGTESFAVNLSSPVNATITDAQAVGTIFDNEGPPSLVLTDVSAGETAGTVAFSVILTTAAGTNTTVDYATTSGTATAGSDFTLTSGTLTYTGAQTTKTVTVPVSDDALSELD